MADRATIRKLALGVAVIFAMAALAAQQLKLYPIDEAASDPTFVAFRADLRKAIEGRDVKFIRAAISRDIELSPDGEEQGPEDFEQLWQPASSYSDLWDTLDELLALGGSFQNGGREFCAPYVYSKWPAMLSPAEGLAVIGDKVNLHDSCATNAPVLAALDHDVVTWNGAHETITVRGKEWAHVKMVDFTAGCVAAEYVRSPLDYHVCFEKIQGKWMITALTEGE